MTSVSCAVSPLQLFVSSQARVLYVYEVTRQESKGHSSGSYQHPRPVVWPPFLLCPDKTSSAMRTPVFNAPFPNSTAPLLVSGIALRSRHPNRLPTTVRDCRRRCATPQHPFRRRWYRTLDSCSQRYWPLCEKSTGYPF